MKSLSLLYLILLIAANGFAQSKIEGLDSTKSGTPFTSSRKGNFSGFIGTNKTSLFAVDYLAINRKKQELNLRRFDKNTLDLVDSRDLFTVIDENFYNEPSEIYLQNNTLFLFSTLTGLKDDFNIIYLEIFNEYGEKIGGKALDTLDSDENFHITESVEGNGFLIASHNRFDNIFEQSIHLSTYTNTGDLNWQTTVKSPVSLQNLKIITLNYSLNAPIYVLCDYGFDGSTGQGGIRETNTDLINNKYAIWAYDHNKSFLKEFDIRLKGKWINGVEMHYNLQNQLIVSGFINETRGQTINGVFSLLINKDLTVENSSFYKYKKSFYEKFVEAKNLDKTKELKNIKLRHTAVLEDGSYFLFGEHYYHYTDRNYDPRTNITTTTENYNYNSIIVAYFDASGNHVWTDRIPKFQHTINDFGYYSSFTVMKNKNEVYLFFNDTERNNELALNDYFNYNDLVFNRRFQITCISINAEGIQSRLPVVDTDNNFMLRAKACEQIDSTSFYLMGETGKSRRVFAIQPAR